MCVQVCIVLEGSVALSMDTHSGMTKVVDLLPQEILCCGVLLQRAEPCTAKANTKCRLLMIPDSAFKDFLHASVLFRATAASWSTASPSHQTSSQLGKHRALHLVQQSYSGMCKCMCNAPTHLHSDIAPAAG